MMTPKNGFILARAPKLKEKTESGIYLPDEAREAPQRAKVIAVPSKVFEETGKEIDCPFKVNDVIVYKKWGGNEVEVAVPGGKETYYFIHYQDILGTDDEPFIDS